MTANAICSSIRATQTIEDPNYDITHDAHHRPTRPEYGEDLQAQSLWQDIIDRARARAKSQAYHRAESDSDEDRERYEIQENDILWEIRCKVSITNISLLFPYTWV